MKYLVAANVLCEPTKLSPDSKVVQWLIVHESRLVVDSIILGEVRVGILSLAPGRKRARLDEWFEKVAQTIECLPWDAAVSHRWAKLVVLLKRKGQTLPLLDSMIAATALEHGLTLVTRNMHDFKKTGVKVIDPFI
jgi:predicted nucleic acid-binding protein